MLRSIKQLKNYKLDAQDGQIGRCKDFLFDDEHWTIRYMAADTGRLANGAKGARFHQPCWARRPGSRTPWRSRFGASKSKLRPRSTRISPYRDSTSSRSRLHTATRSTGAGP